MWDELRALAGILPKRRRRLDDLSRELQQHLDLEADEYQASGLSADDARAAARRAFGNPTLVAEDVRGEWNVRWAETLWRDIKHGARTLRKDAGFSLVAVLTLSLGIGANSLIFTALDALLLRPLPFAHADRLVRLYASKNGVVLPVPGGPSPPDARDYAEASRSFDQIVVYDIWRKNVSFTGAAAEPEQMRVGLVPAAYFEALDVQPLMGRLFTEDENHEGRNYVVAISAHLWATRLAGDPAILGRTLRINDEPYTVVAVMPDTIPHWMEAARPGPVEVWTPVAFPSWSSDAARGVRGGSALGRLKPGISLEQAQADLTLIAGRLAAAYPVDRDVSVVVKRLADTRAGTLKPMLFLLMGAVALILLIACVNLANLLLARNATRQHELALRTALGAGRGGLVRQLLIETLLLSAAGAAVGVAFAQLGLAALARSHPANLAQFDGIALDWRILAFTACIAVLTSLLFGLAPALTATGLNLVDVLKQGGRGVASGRGRALRNALVAIEMAMSLVLLVSASLLVQSIVRLQHQSLGIRQDHLLKGHFYLPPARYPDAAAIARFSDAFSETVRALPGVVDATITTAYPPNNGWLQMLNVARHPVTRLDDVPSAQFGVTDAHFLRTMGIPLVRGRDFSVSDTVERPAVAIVSAEFARRYFPNEDPIGQTIHVGPPPFLQLPAGTDTADSADVTVIGVAGDFRNAGLTNRPEPHLTVLYAQHPLVNFGFKDIVLRTTAEPHLVAPAVTRELHRLDPNLPFAEVQTIEELVDQQTGGQRLTATLLAVFAAGGLALAVVGIYGVVSFLVAQRRTELAVRMAIGASGRTVLWLVLKESLGMAVIGSALGLAAAAAGQRMMSGLLFDVSPIDPLTFSVATLVLLGIAAVATLVPGVRATRIDPARALYQD